MEPSLIEQIVYLIHEEWKELPIEDKPRGVWITFHTPLSVDMSAINQPLQSIRRAWFLQDSMQQPGERSIWEFIRFWMVHLKRSWDQTGHASPDPRFSSRFFMLGMAAFAPYNNSLDLYLETRWGSLWGHGQRLTTKPHGSLQPVQELWRA